MRPIKKIKKKNLRCYSKIPNETAPLVFLYPPCPFALIRLDCCGLSGFWIRGALGVHEELWRKWVKGIEHAIWNFWLITTNIVFKHTTFVTRGKDQLQSLLIVLLHGCFVLTRLRLKRRHFIFGCTQPPAEVKSVQPPGRQPQPQP